MARRQDMSKTEWSLMNICWKKGKASARDIYEETLKQKKRGYQTIKTMLDRLVGKGYLTREKFGPIWLYEPAVLRKSALAGEMEFFAKTVLDNTFTPFFAHLAKKEKLSREELDSLKTLLHEYDEEERGDKP